jgi:DNA (cytosine-5)-methyltransferase 1
LSAGITDAGARFAEHRVWADEVFTACLPAERIGREAALKIDEYWERGRDAAEGPVDVIDMFSGCGGMSAGFQAVNGAVSAYKIAAAYDIETTANATFARNFDVIPSTRDLRDLAADSGLARAELDAVRRPGAPLVLIGCAPCQGFSSHRNATKPRDRRNSLVVDFAKIAASVEPDVILAENVPELLTDKYWRYVAEARRILEQAGYFVHLGVHNLADFGVPQERFRALMIASKTPVLPPRPFLDPSTYVTVRDAIGNLPPIAAGERSVIDALHFSAKHKESTIATIRAVPRDGGNRPPGVGPDCLRRAHERQGKPMYEDVYGRLRWDRPAITITTYSRNPASGRFVHPEQNRGLTIREAANLQGFPTSYVFEGSLDYCFRQIGNAVPPRFAAVLAAHVTALLVPQADAREHEPGIVRSFGPSFSRMIPGIKSSRIREAA